MSKIFYDYLIDLKSLEKAIKKASKTEEEILELSSITDELVHHKVIQSILENLPKENHLEFLDMFQKAPHDDQISKYLKEKIEFTIKSCFIRVQFYHFVSVFFPSISFWFTTKTNFTIFRTHQSLPLQFFHPIL